MPVATSPFILPKGVTGFGDAHWRPEPHDLFKEFKALGHAMARAHQGRVLDSEPVDLVGRNFHKLGLERRGVRVSLLLNAYYPLVGCAEAGADEPVFADPPESLHSETFTFIGKAILTALPDALTMSRLGAAERTQLAYWRPRRIGDILFNNWD